MSLQLAQLIPDGVYRIKSAMHTNRYLDYQATNYDVRPIDFNPKSETQKWIIKGNTTSGTVNTYLITNVASKLHLAFNDDKDKEGNPIRRIKAYSDGQQWTIEPRDNTFVVGWEGNEQTLDYADSGGDDWLLLWDRNNKPNQRWILEPVDTTSDQSVVSGKLKIVNDSAVDIEVRVTSYSNSDGSVQWFTIAAGAFDTWTRSDAEDVMIRVKGTSQEPEGLTTGVLAKPSSVITFTGVGHPGIVVTK